MNAVPGTAKIIPALTLAAVLAAVVLAAPAMMSGGEPEPQRKKKVAEEKDPKYQWELGVIALRYGLPDEAVRYGRKAVDLDPAFFDGWSLIGSALAQKGDLLQASEAFEKAAAIKPGAVEVQRQLGLVYLGLNETAKAETALKKAFDAGGDAESAYALGKLCYQQKRFDEAMDYALKAIQKDKNIVITVTDTGVGIPDEIKPKLFQPLMTTKSKGQGFGLAVVKRLVEAQGGAITYDSKVGVGTTFTITLPYL